MNSIFLDAPVNDDKRRELLYGGQLLVYSPTPSSLKLVNFAREMAQEAFHPLDPETAQFHLPVERFAEILAELKPKFIHAQKSKECIQGILRELGADPEKTYFDVPRMRTSTSDDYLSTGIAYAFHPHRDTWYSAPMCQINWWLPVFPIDPTNCMAFHPRYFSHGLRNSSDGYNYQEWNRNSRFHAAEQIGVDTRPQPKALEAVELQPDVRLLPAPGGVIVFSGAQLHSTVPNTSGRTRYSVDFRTV